MLDLDYRKELARELLSAGITDVDLELKPNLGVLPAELLTTLALGLDFPAGLAPRPQALEPAPSPAAALPRADVLVVTWTVDEQRALADVLTPGASPARWIRYNRKFAEYEPRIRRGAPARAARRLGSYQPTRIGDKDVLCFKSELHLNQDGVRNPDQPGTATLPVKDLFHQMIDEVRPSLVITTGTAGGVFAEHDLGDVVVTRGAKFRCQSEFRNEPFNDASFRSEWEVPTGRFPAAIALMAKFAAELQEPPLLPPTTRFKLDKGIPSKPRNEPDVKLDGRDMPPFHPILTTDFFEFGTSTNHLEDEGCAVEMGDAVLGLAVDERRAAGRSTPDWLVVRNCSDPQINGALISEPGRLSQQAMWAVYYYRGYGYFTSVMSALTCWAVIAGL